jgi:hypothetical protein
MDMYVQVPALTQTNGITAILILGRSRRMMGRGSGESRLTDTACPSGLGVKAGLDCKRYPDDP